MKHSTSLPPAHIPWSRVQSVVFYKRDEIATDLICCAIEADGQVWTMHEEMPRWSAFLEEAALLPDFRTDWFAEVSQPAFAESRFAAFRR